jgi:hypothetical protein
VTIDDDDDDDDDGDNKSFSARLNEIDNRRFGRSSIELNLFWGDSKLHMFVGLSVCPLMQVWKSILQNVTDFRKTRQKSCH